MLMERIRQHKIAWNHLVMDSPVSSAIHFVGANVPSAGFVGLNRYDPGSVFHRTIDVEVLLVVDVLKRPTIGSLLNLPLRGGVRTCP